MSAFVEPKPHIDALLRAAINGPAERKIKYPGDGWGFHHYYHDGQSRQVRFEEAERIGAMLTVENIRSVQHRYPADTLETLPGPVDNGWLTDALLGHFDYSPRGRHLTAVEALKAISGYEYQSCEHPGWETSEARAFCTTFRDYLIGALPGYDTADTWEVVNV